MPAEGAYLSVLRTATAGLAARLDFTLDEIEDLRIAVDEACAMLLAQAIPGTNLECDFELGADEMTITVSVTAAEPQMPARDTFAWTVLSALAGTVDSRLGPDDQVSIVLASAGRHRGPGDRDEPATRSQVTEDRGPVRRVRGPGERGSSPADRRRRVEHAVARPGAGPGAVRAAGGAAGR